MTLAMRSRLIIGATFAVAFILTSLPGPQWADMLRPDWVGLVLIYWCLAIPERVGVGVGWSVGLLQDVIYGSLLGQNAFGKSLVAFIVLKLHLRMRIFPLWQQAALVLLLMGLNQVIVLWIKSLTEQSAVGMGYWVSIVINMLIWPWLFIILRDIRRRGHVK